MLKKILFLLIPFCTFSQSKNFDAVAAQKNVTRLLFTKPDSAKVYLKQLIANKETLSDTMVAKTYNNFGIYYNIVGNSDSSRFYYRKAIVRYSNHPLNKAGSIINLAGSYRNSGDYQVSLKYLEEALAIYEQFNNQRGKGIVYGEMASNYTYMLEYETSIKYLMKGIAILSKTNEKRNLAVQKQKLANLYLKMENFSFAKDLYEESLAGMKAVKDMKNYYLTLINYGDCLMYLGQFAKAKVVILESVQGLETINNKELLYLGYAKLGKIFKAQKDSRSALQYYKKAFDGLATLNSFRFMQIGTEYVNLLNELKKYQEALTIVKLVEKRNNDNFNAEDQLYFYQASAETFKHTNIEKKGIESLQKAMTIQDSLVKLDKETATKEIQAKFQVGAHQQKNQQLSQENTHLEQTVNNSNLKFLIIGFGLLVFFIGGVCVYRKISKENKAEKSKRKEVESTQRSLKMKNEKNKELLEELRKTIDHRQQELTSTTLQLASMQDQINSIIENEDFNGTENMSVKKSLLQLVKNKDYWEDFGSKFNQLHPEFKKKLKQDFSMLTKNDIQFCGLLKLGLSNKEIASILQISHESVITRKYRMKKKMAIEKDSDFDFIIDNL
ncbi:tetratricopeptide repeat protein [Flavobacterium macacae]|nr:tetratricopeptide repeat protein [Flavobacterium macacae]